MSLEDFIKFLSSIWFSLFFGILIIYYFTTKNFNYFKNRNIAFIEPIPLFGTAFRITFGLESWTDLFQKYYNRFSNERIFGIFEFIQPVYVIRDPKLIKQITVKDFDHFLNHRNRVDEKIEPCLGRSLFMMRDSKWQVMRSTLTPSFTSSKLKLMFNLILDCGRTSCDYIFEEIEKTNLKLIELEVKDFYSRFAADVIATCVFDVGVSSVKDRDCEFYKMGKQVSQFTGWQGLKYFGFTAFPGLMKILKMRLYDDDLIRFFRHTVISKINHREKMNIVRNDMLNLLIQTRKGNFEYDETLNEESTGFATAKESEHFIKSSKKLTNWEDDDLVAQCVIFFLAGFETVSTFLEFATYELATNQEKQNILLAEIDQTIKNLNGQPMDYSSLLGMKYMDAVLCETLRKWPPVSILNRECSKTYIMETSVGNKIQINPGDGLWLPIHAIQNDPKYFENPEKFEPERFLDANKKNIDQFTFLPFGHGPRNCIASRFGIIECKVIIYMLLSVCRFDVTERTQVPVKLKKDSFFLKPERMPLKFCLRKL